MPITVPQLTSKALRIILPSTYPIQVAVWLTHAGSPVEYNSATRAGSSYPVR